MSRLAKEFTQLALWGVTAVLLGLQVFLPWSSGGLIGGTSPLRAAGIVRAGFVPTVPTGPAWLVLLLPLLGAVLLAIAPARGPQVMAVRTVLWVVALVGVIAQAVLLGRVSPPGLGIGAILAITACVTGFAGVLVGWLWTRRTQPSGHLSPPPGPPPMPAMVPGDGHGGQTH
jgi:hypothetical protein